nr:MAG TPA: hypothetical protein [Crassvirales sp.]
MYLRKSEIVHIFALLFNKTRGRRYGRRTKFR